MVARNPQNSQPCLLVPVLHLEAEVNPCQAQLAKVGKHLVSDCVGQRLFGEFGQMLAIRYEFAE
jgi:hypothetical protein